jgi:hypothetical protein
MGENTGGRNGVGGRTVDEAPMLFTEGRTRSDEMSEPEREESPDDDRSRDKACGGIDSPEGAKV